MPEPNQTQGQSTSGAAMTILMVLSAGDLHSIGIMQYIILKKLGRGRISPSGCYRQLKKLIEHGFVEISTYRDSAHGRRRYYRLTDVGREVVSAQSAHVRADGSAPRPVTTT